MERVHIALAFRPKKNKHSSPTTAAFAPDALRG